MLSTRVRWAERLLGSAIIARRCRQRIRRLCKEMAVVDQPGLSRAISRRFDGYSCDWWHKVYGTASGRPCIDYVPEDLFVNVFENRLNPRKRKELYKDKNHYDRLNWSCLPETVFRIINGRMFDKSYQLIDATSALKLARKTGLEEFVAKPARDTGGARQVSFLPFAELATFIPLQLKEQSDWIIQQPVIQHEAMAALHPHAVNTIRIVTIRMGTAISVVSAFVRIGAGTSRVDNLTPGKGIGVGVQGDGRLRKYGYNLRYKRYTKHPDHGYNVEGIELPSFEPAQRTCIALHQTIPELDFISWDVAISHDGTPTILEFNVRRPDIGHSQVCNGPVLKPYIDAVLARRKWHMIPGIGAIDEVDADVMAA